MNSLLARLFGLKMKDKAVKPEVRSVPEQVGGSLHSRMVTQKVVAHGSSSRTGQSSTSSSRASFTGSRGRDDRAFDAPDFSRDDDDNRRSNSNAAAAVVASSAYLGSSSAHASSHSSRCAASDNHSILLATSATNSAGNSCGGGGGGGSSSCSSGSSCGGGGD